MITKVMESWKIKLSEGKKQLALLPTSVFQQARKFGATGRL